jgi:hypothetical protein
MISRISQSFTKEMRDFLFRGACGNLIRERWINGRMVEDPDRDAGAMQLGSYFEFILSLLIFPANPSLPKDGKVPVAQFKVRSKGTDVSDMVQDYRDAHANAKHLAGYFKEWGFKVIATQKRLVKGNQEGTLDLICEAERDIVLGGVELSAGERFIIDLKYSGLLSPTTPMSNKHGWKWSKVQKEYHGTQAIQYHYVGGGEMKFFFLVVNSSNGDGECKFFYVPVDEYMTERHLAEGKDYLNKLMFYEKAGGLIPRPYFLTCRKCPLRGECKDKHTFPHAEVVNLNED